MINKPKTETRPNILNKRQLQSQFRKESKSKACPLPNKLLKYNYKHSVDRMQERSLKTGSSFKKMTENQQIQQENANIAYEQQFNQEIKSHHIRQSFLQASSTPQVINSQRISQNSKKNWRQRPNSFCKSATQHSYDERWGSFSKIERKASACTVQKQKNSINPYTKSEYLYVKNQGKDQQIKRKIANQNRYSFGLNLQKSCKIISFELVNPLEKYDKSQKVHKTTSTLPECYIDEEIDYTQRSPMFKVHSRQITISHRKKSAYYRHLRHAQVPLPSGKGKNTHIQAVFNDFEPTPWQSSVKQCDLFYLRAEEM